MLAALHQPEHREHSSCCLNIYTAINQIHTTDVNNTVAQCEVRGTQQCGCMEIVCVLVGLRAKGIKRDNMSVEGGKGKSYRAEDMIVYMTLRVRR
jgi:hypothetical protein